MISGRLERLISAGHFEGWAFDSQAPERPLAVEIHAGDGNVIAEGLANLYRDDLANARRGFGWCAFRLRLERPVAEIRRAALALFDKSSGSRIDAVAQIPFVVENVLAARDGDATFDPFVLERLSQLGACEDVLARYMRTRSATALVRTAYVYMLDRSVDPETLALHAEMLRKGSLSPLRLLEMIADTQEFRARPRTLAAPNAPGFPFVEAANVG